MDIIRQKYFILSVMFETYMDIKCDNLTTSGLIVVVIDKKKVHQVPTQVEKILNTSYQYTQGIVIKVDKFIYQLLKIYLK